MKRGLVVLLLIIFVFNVLGSVSVTAAECGNVPTDGCFITTSTTFVNGVYKLMNGIVIGQSNVILDCNGATLMGGYEFSNGIFTYAPLDPLTNVTIKNCIISNFSSGMQIVNGKQYLIQNNTLKDIRGKGIEMWNDFNVNIVGNSIQNVNNNIDGTVIAKGINIFSSCNVSITGNSIQNVIHGISPATGIEFRNIENFNQTLGCTYGLIFEGNSVKNNWGGLAIDSLTLGNYSIIVRNNFFDNMTYSVSNSVSGLLINNETIKIYNNTFRNSLGGAHITMTYNGQNIEIYNNTIFEGYFGMYFLAQEYMADKANIDIHDNNITKFVDVGIFFGLDNIPSRYKNAGDVKIHNNLLKSNGKGIYVNYLDGLFMHSNNITNNSVGIFFNNYDPGDKNYYFLNNIYSNEYNVYMQVQDPSPIPITPQEISYQKTGNYWGHASPPCFSSSDSNRVDVIDSYAYCGSAPSNAVIIPMSSPA
ncbi:MAG: right-handed parallel beta-helix repeat-containing protein, partial [Nanoarchaeota archaeon]